MIRSLTSLRFLFILFIFLHHSRGYVGGGSMGVAFFFVLGGFCMALGYKEKVLKKDFDFKHYLKRRLIKFYPLHWLCLFAVILLSFLTSKPVTGEGNLMAFVANFALLHSWVPIKDFYFSFNSVSWYLANTVFFTVAFPSIFKWILEANNRGKILIVTLFAVLYLMMSILIPSTFWHPILYISPIIRIIDFVFGIFLALFYFAIKDSVRTERFFKNGNINFVIIFGLIALLILESIVLGDFQLIAPVYWPIIAIIILWTALSNQSRGLYTILENKYLVRLGESSFTFFMIHTIVLKFAKVNIHGAVAFYFVLTLLLTLLIDRFIIPPITKWLTKRILPSMTARS